MTLGIVDHLVYAAPELDAAVASIERLLGITATPGGVHPQWGTRNALIAFGESAFLEIIGPDPAAPPRPADLRPFGIDALAASALATWAIKTADVDALVARARRARIDIGDAMDGRRTRPDGTVLTWRLTNPESVVADGIVPFAIDWGRTPHPAETAATGATLLELRAEHPDAPRVEKMLRAIGVDMAVRPGPRAALIASIHGAKGTVELR